MNGLDDRPQRLAAEATKHAVAPEVEVVMRRGRRRRALSGPVLASTVALAVVLVAVVAVAAVRGRTDRPPVGPGPTAAPSTTTPADRWKTYTDAAHNLRFRYPPDWVVRRRHQEGMVTLAPAEQARRMLAFPPTFAITVGAGGVYYIWLATRFSDLSDHRFELVAAGASGDLARPLATNTSPSPSTAARSRR